MQIKIERASCQDVTSTIERQLIDALVAGDQVAVEDWLDALREERRRQFIAMMYEEHFEPIEETLFRKGLTFRSQGRDLEAEAFFNASERYDGASDQFTLSFIVPDDPANYDYFG